MSTSESASTDCVGGEVGGDGGGNTFHVADCKALVGVGKARMHCVYMCCAQVVRGGLLASCPLKVGGGGLLRPRSASTDSASSDVRPVMPHCSGDAAGVGGEFLAVTLSEVATS